MTINLTQYRESLVRWGADPSAYTDDELRSLIAYWKGRVHLESARVGCVAIDVRSSTRR